MFGEDGSKIGFGVNLSCLFESIGGDRRFVDLLEEELVSDREISAKAFVEGVDELGEGNFSIGLPGADCGSTL